jgi:hypothetical protein
VDDAVLVRAVEAGDDRAREADERLAEGLVRGLGVERAVFAEDDGLLGVDERHLEEGRQQPGAEVFAAAREIVALRARLDAAADAGDLGVDVEFDAELRGDAAVALRDRVQYRREVPAVLGQLVDLIQGVRDLGVGARALAGRGGDDVAPGGVRPDDGRDLAVLLRGGERASAEF